MQNRLHYLECKAQLILIMLLVGAAFYQSLDFAIVVVRTKHHSQIPLLRGVTGAVEPGRQGRQMPTQVGC